MVMQMPDEFYERYKHLSHQELYRMLRAGVPRQVDGVGDTWASVASTLTGLADSLRQSMGSLLSGFEGSASDDVFEGLHALVQRAKVLAEEAAAMRTGLTAMAQALTLAKRQAEAPQEIPAGLSNTVSFVLGAEVGHLPTPEEQAKARERMVWLVARLAAQYGLAEHTNWPAQTPMVLPTAIITGAVTVMHGHGHGDGHQRHGTRLESAGDFLRHHGGFQTSHGSPLLSTHGVVQPHAFGSTSAEAIGALRAGGPAPQTPSVHIVGSNTSTPTPSADGHTTSATSTSAGAAAPPPVGMGGVGMAPAASGPVLGGTASPGGGLGPGAGMGPGGVAADVTWQTSDNVEWIDPDDAAPPVIGG